MKEQTSVKSYGTLKEKFWKIRYKLYLVTYANWKSGLLMHEQIERPMESNKNLP